MKYSNLQKIVEFIKFLNVDFYQIDDYYILFCTEGQYNTLSKVLLFYCTEFKVQPTTSVDDHFKTINIVIYKKNIIL